MTKHSALLAIARNGLISSFGSRIPFIFNLRHFIQNIMSVQIYLESSNIYLLIRFPDKRKLSFCDYISVSPLPLITYILLYNYILYIITLIIM